MSVPSAPAGPASAPLLVSGPVRVDLAASDADRLEGTAIRHEVFVREQGVPVVLEIDARDQDPAVVHLLARRIDEAEAVRSAPGDPGEGSGAEGASGEALGTVRIIPDGGGHWHLGRLAVRREARGLRVGAALVDAVHEAIARLTPAGSVAVVVLDAQVQAKGFYERQGYGETSGEVFLDAGIPYVEMSREVEGTAD